MNYRIKRLESEAGTLAGYHLFSESDSLLLVADLRTRETEGAAGHVRFARPDGTLLATMNLPETTDAAVKHGPDYAIIQDYAVYAIISPHRQPVSDGPHLYFTLEAEGGNWLLLPRPEPVGAYALYGQIPEGLHTYDNLSELDLPPHVGRILPVEGAEHHYLVELSARRWRQTSLVVLALVFLVDTLK